MRNIDFIYTINLDQRPEKFAHCMKELQPYGDSPLPFFSCQRVELSLEAINDLGIKFDLPEMGESKWAPVI